MMDPSQDHGGLNGGGPINGVPPSQQQQQQPDYNNQQSYGGYGQYGGMGGKATPNQQQQLPVLNQLLQSPSPVGSRMPSYQQQQPPPPQPPQQQQQQQYRPQMGYDQQPRRMMGPGQPGGVPPGYPGGYPPQQGPPQGYMPSQQTGYPDQQQQYSTGAYQQQQQPGQPRYPPQPNGPYEQMYNQYGQQPRGAFPDQRPPYQQQPTYPPYQQPQNNYGQPPQPQSSYPPGPNQQPQPPATSYGTPGSSSKQQQHDDQQQQQPPSQQDGMMSPNDGVSDQQQQQQQQPGPPNQSSYPNQAYMSQQQQQQYLMHQQQYFGQQPPQQRFVPPQPQYQQQRPPMMPGVGYGGQTPSASSQSNFDMMAQQQRSLYEQQQQQQQQNYASDGSATNGGDSSSSFPYQQQRPGAPRAMLPPLPQSPGVASPYAGQAGVRPQQQPSFSMSQQSSQSGIPPGMMPPRPQTPGQGQPPTTTIRPPQPSYQQQAQPPTSLSQSSFYPSQQQPFQQQQQQQIHSSDMKESLAESSSTDHSTSFSTSAKHPALSSSTSNSADFPSPPNSSRPQFAPQQFSVNRFGQQPADQNNNNNGQQNNNNNDDDSIRRPTLLPAPPLSPSSVASPISCPDESGDGPLSPTSSTKFGSTFSGEQPMSASKKPAKKSSSSANSLEKKSGFTSGGDGEEKEKPVYPSPPCPPGLTPCMLGPLTQPVEPFERLFELGDEPDRRPFLENLYNYYTNELKIFLFVPVVCKQTLDLFKMYQVVKERGGFWDVNNEKKWKEIATFTIANTSASTGYTLRRHYIKCLLAYELYADRGHADPRQGVADAERQFQNANKKEKRRKENKESKKAAEAEAAKQAQLVKQQQEAIMKTEQQQPPGPPGPPGPGQQQMPGPGGYGMPPGPHPPGMMPHGQMMGGFPGQYPTMGPGGQFPGQFPGHQGPPGYPGQFPGQTGGYPTPPRPPGFGGPQQHPGQPGPPGPPGQYGYPPQQTPQQTPQQQQGQMVGYDQFGRPMYMQQAPQGPMGGYPGQPGQPGQPQQPGQTPDGGPGNMMGQRYAMHHQQQQMQQQQNHPSQPPGYPGPGGYGQGMPPQPPQQQQGQDQSGPNEGYMSSPAQQQQQMMGGQQRPGGFPGMHMQPGQQGMFGQHPPPNQFQPPHPQMMGSQPQQRPQFPGQSMQPQPNQPDYMHPGQQPHPPGQMGPGGMFLGQRPPGMMGQPDFQHQQQPGMGMMGQGGSGSGSLTPGPPQLPPLPSGGPGSASKPPGSSPPHSAKGKRAPKGAKAAAAALAAEANEASATSLGMALSDHLPTLSTLDSPATSTPPRKGKGKKRDLGSSSGLSASSSNASMSAINTPSTPSANQLSTLLAGPPQNQLTPLPSVGGPPATMLGMPPTAIGVPHGSILMIPSSMLPQTIATVVSPFPPGSVEAIHPFTVKRRKMTARDLGQVDPWRVVMSLKTSLIADQNWAIDVLNVLLADDNAAGFFTLGCWPSILDMLCDIFRSTLAIMCEPLSDLVQNWEKISNCQLAIKEEKLDGDCEKEEESASADESRQESPEKMLLTNGHVSDSDDDDAPLLSLSKSEPPPPEKTNGLNGKLYNCWGGGSHALLMLLRAKAANIKQDDRTVILNGPKRKNYTWLTRRGVKVKVEDDAVKTPANSRNITPAPVLTNGHSHNNHLNGDVRQPLSSKSQNNSSTSSSPVKDNTSSSSSSQSIEIEANLRPSDEWDVLKGVSLPTSRQMRLGTSGCPVAAFYFSAPYRSSFLRKKMMKKALKACKNHHKPVVVAKEVRPKCSSPIKVDVAAVTKTTTPTPNDAGLLIPATQNDKKETTTPVPPIVVKGGGDSPVVVVVKAEEEQPSKEQEITVEIATEEGASSKKPTPAPTPKKVVEQVDLGSLIAAKIRSHVAETLPGPSFLPRAHLLSPCDATTLECERVVADRCVALSNIFRNLSTIPGNDAIMAKCWPLLHIYNRLLSLRRHATVTPRRPFAASDVVEMDDVELKPSEETTNQPWWYPILGVLQENVFVVLTNLAGEFELGRMPDEIARPLCLNLVSWYIGESSEATDPFPDQPDPMLTPQRLALETLCKLTVRPGNVDHLIAGPPFSSLVGSLWTALGNLASAPDQVLRELVIVFLAALSQADPVVARCLALNPMAVVLLVSFLEQAEQQCQHAYNANPAHWSSASYESLNISVDILNRAALILLAMAKIDENRSRFRRFDDRLLVLSMSRVLDRQVQQTLAEVVYELDRGVLAAAAAISNNGTAPLPSPAIASR